MFGTPLTNASHWAQGNSWSFTGIHRQLHRIFLRIWQSFDVIFCRICTSNTAWFSRASLDAILTSLRPAVNPLLGCSSENPRSRPIGVRVCPVAPIQLFQHRIWSERGGQWLRTKEEMRPIIHLRQNSLMILMFLLDQVDLLDRQVNLAYHQDGLQLHRILVIEKEWDPEIHRVSGCLCDPHHPSLNLFQLLWMMVMMISHQKKGDNGGRSRSRERVHPHAQVPQEPQTQPVVTPEASEVSDEDSSNMNPSSPATGPTTISWTERSPKKRREI